MKWVLFTGFIASIAAGLGWCGHNKLIDNPFTIVKESHEVRLIKNRDNIRALPSNFRSSGSAYIRHFGSTPTRKGLVKLKMSGSSQFSKRGLKAILKAIPSNNVLLVDLREESHGFFDGTAVSLYGYHNENNMGKSGLEITKEESDFLKSVQDRGFVLMYDDKHAKEPWPVHVQKAFSESELAGHYKIQYVRLYVTDHHRPSDEVVDEFIKLVRSLPEETWIHFHCAGGKGRTTTFMIMYDMIKNAGEVSEEDIMRRQWLLGGKDLSTPTSSPGWKYEPSLERKRFLKKFYKYARDNPNLEMSWSEWLEKAYRRS